MILALLFAQERPFLLEKSTFILIQKWINDEIVHQRWELLVVVVSDLFDFLIQIATDISQRIIGFTVMENGDQDREAHIKFTEWAFIRSSHPKKTNGAYFNISRRSRAFSIDFRNYTTLFSFMLQNGLILMPSGGLAEIFKEEKWSSFSLSAILQAAHLNKHF